MPLFKESNVLYIHIPKTGGTSIEDYFYQKKNNVRDINSLYSNRQFLFNGHSLQHSTYKEVFEKQKYFGIDFSKVTILTTVRNPYHRIISDLFFFRIINKDTKPDKVYQIIQDFVKQNDKYDNHPRPQFEYLIDNKNLINREKIKIIKCENLNQGMINLGYTDFNLKRNTSANKDLDYMKFLNSNSIKFINTYYSKDFEYFGYQKKKV